MASTVVSHQHYLLADGAWIFVSKSNWLGSHLQNQAISYPKRVFFFKKKRIEASGNQSVRGFRSNQKKEKMQSKLLEKP